MKSRVPRPTPPPPPLVFCVRCSVIFKILKNIYIIIIIKIRVARHVSKGGKVVKFWL